MDIELMAEYTALEREMIEADERCDERRTDSIRDAMDNLWYRMTNEQHEALNERGGNPNA